MTRLLLSLILLYRRFLSGRGPLRRVRCTCHHAETCSAYALRIASTHSFVHSLRLIRRRLRRCRTSSIYDCSTGPTRILAWGTDHDTPLPLLLSDLTLASETPASISIILASRDLISRHRSDLPDVLALRSARAGLPHARIVLRRGQVHTLKRGVTTSLLGHTAGE